MNDKLRKLMNDEGSKLFDELEPTHGCVDAHEQAKGFVKGFEFCHTLMDSREKVLVDALEKAGSRFSHIENWHRDYVTPDTFKDCLDVGMTPEQYLRDGKLEVRAALTKLEGE